MPFPVASPDDAIASAILGEALNVHKAEHISLSGARTLFRSVVDVISRRNASSPADYVDAQLSAYFDRVALEHRAGLLSQGKAARKLMQAVTAVTSSDGNALEAIRLPRE